MKPSGFIAEEHTITDKSPLNPAYAETFVFDPAGEAETELGSLFITAEIFSNKTRKENVELLSELATVLKNEYYKNTLVVPLSALKFALKRANNFLASKKNWLAPAINLKLKLVVASLQQNKLHLARLGESVAFILRDGKLQTITASNAVAYDAAPPHWHFENIVSGELLASDRLALGTNQIYKIDENIIARELSQKNLAGYLKKSNEGITSLAMITLHPASPIPPLKPNPAQRDRTYKTNRTYTKPAILILIFIVLVTTVTLVALKIRRETAQNKKEADMLVQEVTTAKEKITDLVAVKNETEAVELLKSARGKLNRLNELGYFKTTSATLAGDLAKIAGELSHAETISELRKIFDLENNSAQFEPEKIILGKNKIFLLGENSFYQFDLNRSTGHFDAVDRESYLVSALAKPENPNTLLLFTEDKITEESGEPENKIIWTRPENASPIKDSALYNNAFYLLAENGLVYKLPFTLSSSTDLALGEIETWTKQSQDTSSKLQATSFSLDGSIFGLTAPNTLVELINGELRNKKDLPENIGQIFTSPSHKNIYLFSPDTGTIIVLDKNLNIKRRLSHPELRGAKSFAVSQQERVVYFLKGKTAYSFEI